VRGGLLPSVTFSLSYCFVVVFPFSVAHCTVSFHPSVFKSILLLLFINLFCCTVIVRHHEILFVYLYAFTFLLVCMHFCSCYSCICVLFVLCIVNVQCPYGHGWGLFGHVTLVLRKTSAYLLLRQESLQAGYRFCSKGMWVRHSS